MALMVGFRNNARDMGKFQCRFENENNCGEIDLFKILLLFIIFEVEMIFIVM